MKISPRSSIAMASCLALSALIATGAFADEGDPPTRAARLAYIEGAVSFQPAGTSDWVAPPINRPLTTGDQLWSDRDSRAELQLDGSLLRLSANTAVTLLNISDNVTQIQLSSGTLFVHVRRLDDNESYEIDTPNLAFTVLRPGSYRIAVDGSGNSTAILIRRGQGEVTGGGSVYPMEDGEYDGFYGTDELSQNALSYNPDPDEFEAWTAGRDAVWDNSESARYVSADVVGYADLDGQGTWTPDPDYGPVWFPRAVATGWAPYHFGHWAYVLPWGYTWVDDSPWGFAPFHYGRWAWVRGAWGWIPAPPRRAQMAYVRPVYAPALVAWVGIGSGIAWFALGPHEVYVPSYHVSPRYVNNINISNTNVNTTVVTNVYNATIVNKTAINNINYVNRNVSGAIAATTPQAFASAQPVARNAVRVDSGALTAATVATLSPPVVPTKQAVLGSGRSVAIQPSAVVQSRAVVARIVPPPAPPTIERKLEAIRSNGGAPLSTDQIRQISPAASMRAAIKIAPPARALAPARTIPQPVPQAPSAPIEAARTAPNAVHPNELPPQRPAASPAGANSVLERQHLQEQQQQQARQEAERQKLAQQQEAEHQRAAQAAADQARQQELERQHQAQTQQLAQQHALEQQQLQAKQQEQKRQQESLPPPKPHKPDSPPRQ